MEDTVLGGRYELHEVIGAGGSGRVYRGYDRRLRRTVAIKLLDERTAADTTYVTRFNREARTAAGLSHANIVTIFDWGETEPSSSDGHVSPYLVMEYVPGETLRDRIEREGPLPEGEALAIAAQIAGALEEAHRAGIIHRDVNPRNILLTPGGRAKIADFGIARAADMTELTASDKVFGTVQYLSPEQARGLPVDPRTDLYSLGVTLFEMLTGQPPFRGTTPIEVALQHVHTQPPDLRPLRPGLTPATEAVVKRLLAKNPARRFPNAAAAESALRAIHPRNPDTRTATPPRILRERQRTIPRWLIAAPFLLVFLILLGAGIIASSVFHGSHTAQGTATPPHRIAALHPTSTPTARPTAKPTARPAPAAHRVKKPAPPPAPTASPTPTATPPPAPTSTPSARTVPASVASAQASPSQAVISFYRLVGEHQFSAAASLWSSAMQQQYPPPIYINHRFASTASMDVRSAPTVSTSPNAGTAVVSVDVVETDFSGATHEYVGTWNLVHSSQGWLLNSPNLHSA